MEYDAVIENDVLEEFLRTCKKKHILDETRQHTKLNYDWVKLSSFLCLYAYLYFLNGLQCEQ